MNTQQLQYALAIAEHGSISKAAQSLFVSQPHLSKSIQALEAEIQYPIFVRKASGVAPTSQGVQFLNRARSMLADYRDIMSLSTLDTLHSFHVSGVGLYMVISAFCDTCQEFGTDFVDFQLINQGTEKTIETVYSGKADIGILVLPEDMLTPVLSTCRNKKIVHQDIAKLPMAITLREGHPLIREMEAALASGLPLPMEKLSAYPFIDYSGNDILKMLEVQYPSCVNHEKIITVNEMIARHQITSQTDAYCMGCVLAEDTLSSYHLRSFPIPNSFYYLMYIYRGDNELSEECQDFIRNLEKETNLYYPE